MAKINVQNTEITLIVPNSVLLETWRAATTSFYQSKHG